MVTNMSSTSFTKAPLTLVTSAAFCFRTGSPMIRISGVATSQGYGRALPGPSSQSSAGKPSAPSDPGSVRLSLSDLELTLATDRGVFSTDRIDPGTRLLLQEAPRPGDAM